MPKVTVSSESIQRSGGPGRQAEPNEWLAVIETFNDGKTRLVEFSAEDKPGKVVRQLRAAAESINRGVRIQYKGFEKIKDAKVGDGFLFELRDPIKRERKETAETETAATVPAKPAARKSGK